MMKNEWKGVLSMRKTVSYLLSLLTVLSLIVFPARADETKEPAVYGTIGLQMVEPEGFQEAGFQVLYNDSLFNIVLNTDDGQQLLTIIFRLSEEEFAFMQQDASYALMQEAGLRMLGEMEGYTYLLLHVGDAPGNVNKYYAEVLGIDFNSLPESTRNQVIAALPMLSQAIPTLEIVPVSYVADGVFDFSTTDLNGNPVTSDIIAQKDLTVINVWGTFCGPCIGEMPALAAWDKELPENVQIIGIISDVYAGGDTAAARNILSSTGVTFLNLLTNDSLIPLLSQSQYVPTTYIVDRNGNLVAAPIIGADVEGYKAVVENYLAP